MSDRDRNPAEEAAGEDQESQGGSSDVLSLYRAGQWSQSEPTIMKTFLIYLQYIVSPGSLR